VPVPNADIAPGRPEPKAQWPTSICRPMNIYVARAFLYWSLALSAILLVAPNYCLFTLGITLYKQGVPVISYILGAAALLSTILSIALASAAFGQLRWAHLPVLSFRDEEVICRRPHAVETFSAPYERIVSVVIPVAVSRYSSGKLEITLDDGRPPISTVPSFSVSTEAVMAQFEERCPNLKRRYQWQWDALYRMKAAQQA
jgi:hypothetical protein